MIKFELKHPGKRNRVVDVETVLRGWIVTLRVRLPGMWLLQGVSHLCHRVYITCCALC